MNDIFVSYSRKDTEFARKLTESFKSKDLDAWVDWQDIPPSVDWMKEIEKGIEEADLFVFLVSPDSIASEICAEELAHGVLNGKRVIPVIVREFDPKTAPPTITHLNWIFFSRPHDVYEEAFEKLMLALQTDFEWVQTHKRLQVRALEWERNHKEDSFLLRGRDLESAEAQLTVNIQKSPRITEVQEQYVRTSRSIEDRQLEEQRAKERQLEIEKTVGARSRRLVYMMTIISTISFAALYFWLYRLVTDMSWKALKDQMVELIETSSVAIDVDQVQTIIQKYPEGAGEPTDNAYYKSLGKLLSDIKHHNTRTDPNLSLYVITQGRQPQDILVLASADGEFSYNEAHAYTSQNNAQLQGLQSTSNDFEILNYSINTADERISACTPLINKQSVSIGALCTDFHTTIVFQAQSTVAKTLGGAFIAIYPLMLAIVFFTTRSLSKMSGSVK